MPNHIWIGDTGASCHIVRSLTGMSNLKNGSSSIKVGSGSLLKVEKIGTFKGIVEQKDGTSQTVELKDVHYVPKMFCNLFSITTAMSAGCTVTGGNNEPLTMSKGGKSFRL